MFGVCISVAAVLLGRIRLIRSRVGRLCVGASLLILAAAAWLRARPRLFAQSPPDDDTTGNESAARDDSTFPTVTQFVGRHLTWILSLLPFVLVGLKLLSNARGNIEVFQYLLQNVNAVTLLLASLVPLIPTALFWAIVIIAESIWLAGRGHWLVKLPDWLIIPVGGGLLIIAFLMPRFALLVNGGLLVFLVAHRRLWRRVRRRDEDDPLRGAPMRPDFIGALMFAVVAALFSTPSMWLPIEVLQVRNWSYLGYVLASTEQWTTLLERDNTVNVFPTADVKSRTPCASDDWWSKPVWDVYPRYPRHLACPTY